MNVRALFRVTGVESKAEGKVVVHMAPTYQTKHGVVCEENKAFSKWTPSGTGKMAFDRGAPIDGYFVEGDYYYLDILDAPVVELVAGYSDLVDPRLVSFYVMEFHKTVGQIVARLRSLISSSVRETVDATATPPVVRWREKHGAVNALVFGSGNGFAEVDMTITNLTCAPAFDFDPGSEPRLKHIVFSRCP